MEFSGIGVIPYETPAEELRPFFVRKFSVSSKEPSIGRIVESTEIVLIQGHTQTSLSHLGFISTGCVFTENLLNEAFLCETSRKL